MEPHLTPANWTNCKYQEIWEQRRDIRAVDSHRQQEEDAGAGLCISGILFCFCDRLFPKYSPLGFIEVGVHLYLSGLNPPSCVLSSKSPAHPPTNESAVKLRMSWFQPIRGQRLPCLQVLNISQYLAFVTLLHRKSYTLQLDWNTEYSQHIARSLGSLEISVQQIGNLFTWRGQNIFWSPLTNVNI